MCATALTPKRRLKLAQTAPFGHQNSNLDGTPAIQIHIWTTFGFGRNRYIHAETSGSHVYMILDKCLTAAVINNLIERNL